MSCPGKPCISSYRVLYHARKDNHFTRIGQLRANRRLARMNIFDTFAPDLQLKKINDMKTKLLVILFSAAVLTSCSNKKEAQTTDAADAQAETATVDLRGQWYIENIVLNDSVSVRPADVTPDVKQYITFEDSTFYIQTNCNSIQGEYRINGDSISFPVTLMTEMACDNMETESAICKVLPNIATVDLQNDSVARLCGSTPAECIMLVKANETK